jgi:histone H3/H4
VKHVSETEVCKEAESNYLVKNSIRDFFNKSNKRVDSEIFSELNKSVEEILKRAVVRAEKNKRATVRPEDV